MLAVGAEAPDFTVVDHEANAFTLSEHRGHWVLLWWYPKADTPGCTSEGCALRDQFRGFAERDCEILGISFDTPAENAAFREKHGLPFALLCDTDQAVGVVYGAKKEPDEPFSDFPRRVSYLIDPDGVIRRAYAVSEPAEHAAVVLADLAALQP